MRIHGSSDPFIKTLTSGLLGLTLVGAMAAGCSGTSAVVQQQTAAQPHGSVRLEEVADWEFEAAHPSTIDAATLGALLRGVMISDAQIDLSNLPVDGSKPMRVFSDEDVHYLAPLLAQALSQAQPEYVVAFRLSSSAGSGSEPTAGTLYVRNDRLHLTLTEHQGSLAQIKSSLFSSGRPARIVTMAPESAGRIEQALPAIAHGQPQVKSLAIDYAVFAKNQEPAQALTTSKVAPEPRTANPVPASTVVAAVPSGTEEQSAKSARPTQPTASEKPATETSSPQGEQLNETLQELQDARQAMARKDAKINALRRDLESMRTQLETKDKELRAVKTRQAQPKRDKRNTAELTVR
ncbi:MAG: hypothetical protein OJF52_001354 [Nitrospira sp.]|jgi:hypothetical protein|nr:MAG: hypothetical protein OJF52_001354 [Nitrospira sp.]